MATVNIDPLNFEVELIICDKDGTLTNFNTMWGNWIKNWIGRLLVKVGETSDLNLSTLAKNLDKTLGFNREMVSVIAESPVAVSTVSKINTVAMTVLYQSGLDWHLAEEAVGFVASQPVETTADMVRPVGDVKQAFECWAEAGIKIIIATSDDREPTLAAIKLMGIEHLITSFYCGDDPIANKPNPEAIHQISGKYGISPNRMLMVGDAVSDMAFGRNGQVAGCIAISGGSGDQDALEQAADIVIDSVDKIRIV